MQKRRLLMAAVAFGAFLSIAGAQQQSSNKEFKSGDLLGVAMYAYRQIKPTK